MESRLPILVEQGVPDIWSLAFKMVERVKDVPLFMQLKTNRIYRLVVMPILQTSLIWQEEGWGIYLRNFRDPSDDNGLLNFAHELGHSFHHDYIENRRMPIRWCLSSVDIEDFAETFAFLWLSHKRRRIELKSFLNKVITYDSNKKRCETLDLDLRQFWP